jgi:hypothetical protein
MQHPILHCNLHGNIWFQGDERRSRYYGSMRISATHGINITPYAGLTPFFTSVSPQITRLALRFITRDFNLWRKYS